MAYNYDYQKFILVTNAFDSGEDALFFTIHVTEEHLHKTLKIKGQHFDEIYPITSEERPVYCYDPVYCDEVMENQILEAAATYNEALHGKLIMD
jgi:hypothetical protein